MEAINCINCGNALVKADLNERLLLIACSHCGTMHDVYKTRHGRTMPVETDQVPIPEKFQVTENGDELHIRFKHQNWTAAGIAGAVSYFVGDFVFGSFFNNVPVLGKLEDLVALAIAPAVAGYYILRKVRIVVRKRTIKLGIAKYLILRSKNIMIDSVDQLFVRRHIHKTKEGTHYTYSLNVIYQQEKAHELLAGFSTAQEALALEHLIERWAGIADVEFVGEYSNKNS